MSNTPLTPAHISALSQLPSDIILSTLQRLRAVSPIAPLVESPRGTSPRSHNRPWELSPRSRGTSPNTSPRDAAAAFALASSTTHKFAIPSPRGPSCEAVDHNVPCGRRSPPSEGTPAASKAQSPSQQPQPVYTPVPVIIPSTAAQYHHLLNAYAAVAAESNARAVRMPANYMSQALLLQAAAQLNQLSSAQPTSSAQPSSSQSNVRAETGKRKRASTKADEASKKKDDELDQVSSSGDKEDDDDDDDENAKKKKRANPDQVQILEEVFLREPLPSRRTKEQLASRLGLSHRRVQVWFQNRRAKERRHLRNKGINDAEVLPNPWAK